MSCARPIALLVLVACGTEAPRRDVRAVIEYQPRLLANASNDAWVDGNGIVVSKDEILGLSIRVTLVDDRTASLLGMRTLLLESYGASTQLELHTRPGCPRPLPDVAPSYCVADFTVASDTRSIQAATAVGLEDSVIDCFYFAVADSDIDSEALKAQLDREVASCRDAYAR